LIVPKDEEYNGCGRREQVANERDTKDVHAAAQAWSANNQSLLHDLHCTVGRHALSVCLADELAHHSRVIAFIPIRVVGRDGEIVSLPLGETINII